MQLGKLEAQEAQRTWPRPLREPEAERDLELKLWVPQQRAGSASSLGSWGPAELGGMGVGPVGTNPPSSLLPPSKPCSASHRALPTHLTLPGSSPGSWPWLLPLRPLPEVPSVGAAWHSFPWAQEPCQAWRPGCGAGPLGGRGLPPAPAAPRESGRRRGFSKGFVGKIRAGGQAGSPGHRGSGPNPGLSLSVFAGGGATRAPRPLGFAASPRSLPRVLQAPVQRPSAPPAP